MKTVFIVLLVGFIVSLFMAFISANTKVRYCSFFSVLAVVLLPVLACVVPFVDFESDSDLNYCVVCDKPCEGNNSICDICLEDFVEWMEDNKQNET